MVGNISPVRKTPCFAYFDNMAKDKVLGALFCPRWRTISSPLLANILSCPQVGKEQFTVEGNAFTLVLNVWPKVRWAIYSVDKSGSNHGHLLISQLLFWKPIFTCICGNINMPFAPLYNISFSHCKESSTLQQIGCNILPSTFSPIIDCQRASAGVRWLSSQFKRKFKEPNITFLDLRVVFPTFCLNSIF